MPDPVPDSNLTPAQDDAVRALLASARHSTPAPPDVVARLEATLASLTEERRELRPETRAPVVTLASRRRRTAATFVLAAAAVVVAGVGIGQLPDAPWGSSGSDAGGSAESATSGEDRLSTGGSDGTFDGESGSADEKQGPTEMRSQEGAQSPSSAPEADVNALDSGSALKPQVRQLRRLGDATTSFSADPTCPLPDAGSGETVSVTYNGLPGALVFRVPVGSTQQVDLYLCGEPEALRSLRLRAP